MKNLATLVLLFWSVAVFAQDRPKKTVIVVHGGAGAMSKDKMTPEKEAAYKADLEAALLAGNKILRTGGTSMDAVVAAIKVLEDSPLFNAGRGAVLTHDGRIEHDASIMNGKTLEAGAVAEVHIIKNPITAARAVIDHTKHVLLAGHGAELFAKSQGIEMVDTTYFRTEERIKQWQKNSNNSFIKEPPKEKRTGKLEKEDLIFTEGEKFGTVGCVALDEYGNLAAGTSTGGLSNKRHGRIGDTPIVGAGNYANNKTCAVSGTGEGEYFMRGVIAYDISALMDYKEMSVSKAANKVIMEKLPKAGGSGGAIALDREGNFAMPFNTDGMFRGFIENDEPPKTLIYKED